MSESHFRLDVIGDSGPFSRLGKSIGYRIIIGNYQFLLDCGAPVFQLLGPEGLENIDGIIGTHAHEDHKRWFTDIALYNKFSSASSRKVPLIATQDIMDEFRRSSGPALEETLSGDATEVVNYVFDDYVNPIRMGPKPKFKCKKVRKGNGNFSWRVIDRDENSLPADRAKVFKPDNVQKPRILFRDPRNDIWVEPRTYYSFDDDRFYESDESDLFQHESGLEIKPIKSTAWHGPPSTSLQIKFDDEVLFFTSDTVFDKSLWKKLARQREPRKKIENHSGESFIRGNINDYIEQTWSQNRLEKALEIYEEDHAVLHDVSGPWTTVHSEYKNVKTIDYPLLLTHSPDEFTTLSPMAHLGKSFTIKNNQFYEIVSGDEYYEFNATCYQKQFSEYFVGYKDSNGKHLLVKFEEGNYSIFEKGESLPDEAETVEQIKLYRDIGGDYYPTTEKNEEYLIRPDDRVEKLTMNDDGSEGTIVEGMRSELDNKVNF